MGPVRWRLARYWTLVLALHRCSCKRGKRRNSNLCLVDALSLFDKQEVDYHNEKEAKIMWMIFWGPSLGIEVPTNTRGNVRRATVLEKLEVPPKQKSRLTMAKLGLWEIQSADKLALKLQDAAAEVLQYEAVGCFANLLSTPSEVHIMAAYAVSLANFCAHNVTT